MVRFALVGFGAWGSIHAQALDDAANAQLCAIVSSSQDGVRRAKSSYPDVLCTQDYRAVLARDDIDAVTIATPNALHEEQAVAALDAGKHVLLEKPMAIDSAACERINAAARRCGRVLNVAHELRTSTQYRSIREWIEQGQLGRPLSLQFSLFRRSFRSGERNWRYAAHTVGTWLLEELIHYVDLATWYLQELGPPSHVTALGNQRGDTNGLFHNHCMRLRWPCGAYATLTQSLAGFEHHNVLELIGSKGAARAVWSGSMDRSDSPTATLTVLEGLTGGERFDVGTPRQIDLGASAGEIAQFHTFVAMVVESIHSGQPVVSGSTAAQAVALCEVAQHSMLERSELALDAVLERAS